VRALAAAHPGAVPGRQFGSRLAFAGRHAECVFISGQNKPSTKVQVDKVRASAVEAGRNPEDIKVFMGFNVIVGETEELAWNKHAEYLLRQRRSRRGALSASTGIDFPSTPWTSRSST
jgi:alkanesulfonate monooxygenase SsuD/methylene tetrahydromethanopterin reductase-like flavin-dependent oxidoreductase (luciferase family)